jgi:hypothetical protein
MLMLKPLTRFLGRYIVSDVKTFIQHFMAICTGRKYGFVLIRTE